MILSSADILRILSGDAIIRQEAKIVIVEGRPGLGVDDVVYIYVDKYPTVDEFEATWNIWVQDNSGMGRYVLDAMTVLLPGFDFNGKHYTTTDFTSERTVIKTQEEIDREEFKDRFSGLEKDLQGRLSTVRDGLDGIDGRDGVDGLPGKDGRDGRDGRDGKDLDATQVELEDLADVEQGIPKKRGQVLTWNGKEWTNLFVPQVWSVSAASGGGSGDGEGVIISDTAPETRDDGSALQEGDQWWDSSTGVMYVWYVDADSGQWVQSSGGDGGGASTLAGLLDTDTSGVEDGDILVYRTATGNWTAETASLGGGDVQSVNGQTGVVTLTADDVGALELGDNVSELVNDANYITLAEVPGAPVDSVNGQTGVVLLTADDVGALESGDNISELNNDSGYITLAEVPESGIPEAPQDGQQYARQDAEWTVVTATGDVEEAPQDGNYYVRQNGTWVSLADALSALNDRTIDGGDFTTGSSDGDTEVVDGGNFS